MQQVEVKPQISVGLVTYNSVSTLELCLASILRNLDDGPTFEIVIVDNGSTDGSLALAHESLKDSGCNFHLVARGRNNLSEARNNVVEVALGDFIAFTDPDCEVPENWLLGLYLALTQAESKVAGVGGANRPASQHWLVPLFEAMGTSILGHFGSSQLSQTPQWRNCDQISTCNALFRKNALTEVGGFTDFGQNFGEDLDLNFKLRKAGWLVQFSGANPVTHHLPAHLSTWLRKCFNYGRSQIPALQRNGWTISSVRLAPSLVLPLIFAASLAEPSFFLILVSLHVMLTILLAGSFATGALFAVTQWAYLAGYVTGGFETAALFINPIKLRQIKRA